MTIVNPLDIQCAHRAHINDSVQCDGKIYQIVGVLQYPDFLAVEWPWWRYAFRFLRKVLR